MKTPQEIIKEVVSRDTSVQQLGSIRSYFVDDYAILAMEAYADQFKPKWVQVVDRLPEKSIDEILVRGGELYDEKKHYVAEFSKGYFYDVNDVRIYPHEWMYIPS